MNFDSIRLTRGYAFGTDPEVFVRDGKGQIIPAYTFLPGKEKAIRINDIYSASIYNDGFQAELRADSSGCIAYVVDAVAKGLKGIWEKSNENTLVLDNAPIIPIDTLRKAPEESVIFGCDPSMNAYFMGGKPCGDPRKQRHRFTGFHIHVSGWKIPESPDTRQKLLVPYVKALDSVLGVYFVAAGAHLESKKRRQYYGLAGEYRLPLHGLEYRVLSSVVLAHPGITNLAFELARGTMAMVDSKAQQFWVADEKETIAVINENDQKGAREILKRNKDLFYVLTQFTREHRYIRGWEKDIYNIAMYGIDSVVKNPGDFVTNWKFKDTWQGHCNGKGESLKDLIGR